LRVTICQSGLESITWLSFISNRELCTAMSIFRRRVTSIRSAPAKVPHEPDADARAESPIGSGGRADDKPRDAIHQYSLIQARIRALRTNNDLEAAIVEARQGFALLEAQLQGLAFATDAANNLGMLLGESGHWSEAEFLLEQSARVRERSFGTNHPGTATAFMNLGIAKLQLNKLVESERLLQVALRIRQTMLSGAQNAETAIAAANLAALYDKTNQPERAVALRNAAQSYQRLSQSK
jgi:tetratricopeptide (TPR) repeat protein